MQPTPAPETIKNVIACAEDTMEVADGCRRREKKRKASSARDERIAPFLVRVERSAAEVRRLSGMGLSHELPQDDVTALHRTAEALHLRRRALRRMWSTGESDAAAATKSPAVS